jgi:SAM-dependent methyltransferase
VRRLRGTYRRVAFPEGYFRSLELSEQEIHTRAYESYLYGSREAWVGHGSFQLFFLKMMGMRPTDTLLDIGCGPLRGGIHVIRYLDEGHYYGVDFNESFIRAAKRQIEIEGLGSKEPMLQVIGDAALDGVAGRYKFALAFSVLNHCNPEQRRRFIERVPERLEDNGRLYVTHAAWFDQQCLAGTKLVLSRVFSEAAEVSPHLRMADWGWPERRPSVFPILELHRAW